MKLARLVASLVVLLLAVGAYAQPVTDGALTPGISTAKDMQNEKEAFEAWRIATDLKNEQLGVVGRPRQEGIESAILDEGFEGATFPPDGWTAVVVAGATGWTSTTTTPHTGTKSAYNTYQTAGTLGSKWLISKRVNLVASSVYTLSFWARRGFTSVYPPDTVYVRLSTVDSLPASFSTLLYKCYTGTIADTATDPNIYTTNYRKFTTTFTGITGTAWIAFDHQDDDGQSIYLDDVNLDVPVPLDAGALLLASPATGGCYGTNQTVSIRVKNYGSSTINFATNNLTVSASVAGPNPQTFTPVTLNSGTLAAGATQDVTVSTTYNMTASGSYVFDASTSMPGDSITANNAMPTTTRIVLGTAALPQSVDFTGFTGSNLTTVFPNWYEATGASPSGTTSAWTSQTGLGGGGNVTARINLYTTSRNEWIVGPKFLATATSQVRFKASVTDWNSIVVGDTMGSDDKVRVMVSTNCGGSWTAALTIDSTTNLTPLVFTPFTVSLAAYAGQQLIVAFYATDGPIDDPRDYDFHIDDVELVNIVPKDIQVANVFLSPVTLVAGAPVTVKAEIRNQGTEPNPASVPLTYKVGSVPGSSGDGTAQTFSPTWTGNVDTVTFTTTYTPPAAGPLTVGVRSFYPGDAAPGNDSAKTTRVVFAAGTIFAEDFTSYPPAGWTRTTYWVGGTAVQPDGSSGGAAECNFYSASAGRLDTLLTPVMDLSSFAEATPKLLQFYHAYRMYTGGESDSMRVIFSSDGGTTWEILFNDGGTTLATGPAQSAGYIPAGASEWRSNVIPIPAGYLVATFRMAFVGVSDFGNNFWLDNVVIRTLPSVDYTMETLTQVNGIPDPFRITPPLRRPKTGAAGIGLADVKGAPASPGVNNSFLLNSTVDLNSHLVGSVEGGPEANLPITMRTIVKNIGQTSPTYQVGWTVDGAAQTPVSRPGIASLARDTVTLSMTPAERGTYTTTATATVAGDANTSDNSATYLRTLVYPDPNIRIRYDNGSSLPDDHIGFTTPSDFEAGVRFVAPQDIKLANIDASYVTGSSTDSVLVKVYAAGVNDSTPGAVLYSKAFAGPNYLPAAGGYVTLPLGNDAPSFANGSTFWVSILFQPLSFPMGAHNAGFTPGHSFYSGDSGATWSSLKIPEEWAWLLRVVGVSSGSGVSTTVTLGWNMISNPVTTSSDSVKQLFPTSLFPYGFAFAGAGGYQQRYRMANGVGYWGKFPGAAGVTFTGGNRTLDTIEVAAGWNMVGSISTAVDTATIVSLPPGLRTSTAWFGYNGGYTAAPALQPGKGYWVKAGTAGSFVLVAGPAPEKSGVQSAGPLGEMSSLTVRDALGRSQTLSFGAGDGAQQVEMPPLPPEGAFDVRFETEQGGAMMRTHAAGAALPISIRSAAAPLTVSWSILDGAYTLDAGQGLTIVSGQGSVRMTSVPARIMLRSAGSSELPAAFALMQNYPNPFNPSTTIRFALPVESKVSVEIFNALGQRVKTLVTGTIAAGYHNVDWNGTGGSDQQLGSGVYFVRFSATGSDGKTFGDTRKLMLLK